MKTFLNGLVVFLMYLITIVIILIALIRSPFKAINYLLSALIDVLILYGERCLSTSDKLNKPSDHENIQ